MVQTRRSGGSGVVGVARSESMCNVNGVRLAGTVGTRRSRAGRHASLRARKCKCTHYKYAAHVLTIARVRHEIVVRI